MRFSTKRKLLDGSLLEKADRLFWELASKEEQNSQRPKKTVEKKEKQIFAFEWKGTKADIQLEFLHQQLIEGKFIAPDTLQDLFKGVFSGYEIIKPLKIKWIAKGKNKSVSKSSLFHFIDLLVKNSFIDITEIQDTSIFYNKIQNTFVDSFGNPLKNLKQSNAQRASKPTENELLEKIIQSIPK